MEVLPTAVCAEDVCCCPDSVGVLLYELCAGDRLVLEKAVPVIDGLDVQLQCRLFLVSSH